MNTTKKTYQRIPVLMLEKQVSPKEAYLYAKLSMLENKHYCQAALGKTPLNKKVEMGRDTVSKTIEALSNDGFIEITQTRLEGHTFNSNVYFLLPYEGYYRSVYNDFINLETLDANTKGFAILLQLYGKKVDNISEISRATGVSINSCKKYIAALEAEEVLVDGELSREYFGKQHIDSLKREFESKSEAIIEPLDSSSETYKYRVRCLENLRDQLSNNYITYKMAIGRITDIEAGTYWNGKQFKSEENICL